MDYDLVKLGPREFEHLTQAVCVAALGVQVEVFGDGPDGGREATTEGRITWEAVSDGGGEEVWEGYTVVQAKFRLRPGDVASNLTWLLAELRKELSRWTDKRYRRHKARKPDYLLIVTNVPLSAADGGGIDTAHQEIAEIMDEHALDLHAWRLWHYDSMCALLDVHRSVRITYGGFLTTGDVLAQMDEWLGRQRNNFGAALAAHAVKDMLAQQYLRLGQAGDPHEDKLPLASVAVDLPAHTVDVGEEETSDEQPPTVAALAYIIERGERVQDHNLPEGSPKHLLMIGGPGQGKSTLTQMLCHAYRVGLLRDAVLSAEARRLRDRLAEHFEGIGLTLPQHLRWPVRVVLSEYGEYLAANPGRSLLRYLAERISAAGPNDVTGSDLNTWLGRWPWLLVLDGMDEVVSPHVREWVTAGISDFLVDVAQADADVLVVVTTRPQGYAGEFGAEDYQSLDLLALDTVAAVTYAKQLTSVRLSEDSDLRQRVDDRLVQAAAEPETSRLMRTPLQVTIMTLLLERRQRAPHDRYQLFNAYFDTIYARETNKPTDVGRLLEDYRADIEAIHESVALELQNQAETVPAHEDSIPAADLGQHALERLRREGNDEEPAKVLAGKISKAATHRLVLLVPHGESGVGFEIRSLQEYMAARALTRGEGPTILKRLRPLIPSAHWRNTWLLAAGRLFRDREDLRGSLISMLLEVDNEGLLPWLVRAGGELATDLLADDVAIRSPQYRRLLADQALDRLNNFPDVTSRTLGPLLLELAGQDTLIRQKVDQQIVASLAAGGGARAHAVLMLHLWTNSTGGLAAKARQLLPKHAKTDFPENHGVFLLAQEPRRARALPVHSGPKKMEYLASHIPPLEDDDRSAINRLFKALPFRNLSKLSSEDSARTSLILTRASLMSDHTIMTETLGCATTADAFAELVDRIPPEDWHVAAYLRNTARHWYARRVTTTAI